MRFGAGFFSYFLSRMFRGRDVTPSQQNARTNPSASSDVISHASNPTPMSNDRLLELASKHQPPQSWYEEDVNPFEPERR